MALRALELRRRGNLAHAPLQGLNTWWNRCTRRRWPSSRERSRSPTTSSTAVAGLAYGYARTGRLEEARQLAAWLEQRPDGWSGASGLLHAALGDTDRAVASLQTTLENRRNFAPGMRCTCTYTHTYLELQDDPRVQQLVQRVGFPD